MNRSEWERAKSLLAQAGDLPPADREPFVIAHCADPELRRELLDLLKSPAPLSGIINANALQLGDLVGPYKIQELLGVGGMGEVYRGRDMRLGRDVALKIISPRLVGDPSLRHRFEREARSASALNHPSIVTIYDVGETDGISWIAMEWVEGRTLRQVLAGGPLPIREVCAIARQIADGLAAAHAKGIVHRDLKPENVMVGTDGRTKILDFGLARHSFGGPLGDGGAAVETVAVAPMVASLEGTILGTVGYMSPEQASGSTADYRSDQFALGVLAYEMLAGRRAFARPTAVETLSAIIREEPAALAAIRSGIPEPLLGVIIRCLAKAPADRFASTRDLALALSSLEAGAPLESPSAPPTTPAVQRASPQRSVAALTKRVVVSVVAAVTAFLFVITGWNRFAASREAIDSVAILPFENVGGDADAEYLGNGLTESLINQMSRVPSLKVMARGTVFRFKGTTDPQDAGRKLGVGAIVTGTVARRGTQLMISAELIEIATGARLWGETYDRPFADLQRVQDRIASDISDGLRLHLSGREKQKLVAHGTENPEAYELFLKAHNLLSSQSEEGDLEARRLLQLALEKDPKFVDAHLEVAATYARSAGEGYAPPGEAWSRADDALKKAAALDPANPQVRAGFAGRRFQYDWDWTGTEREYAELVTDPRVVGPSTQFHPLTMFFWATGRPEQSIAIMERALRSDPENLESRIMMANFLAQAGRLEEAIAGYRAIATSAPANPSPLLGLADILKRRGEVKGAIDTLRKAYELAGEERGARLLATARTDTDYENAQVAVARNQIHDLQELAKERYVSPLDLARLYAQVGDREKAFACLELAFSERSMGMVLLKVDRAWDRIRDDARFAALVRRVGIP
jgi:eukaryotic-like serine/threonine-protein kinase